MNNTILKLGYWSALFASIFSLTYIVGQLAEWFDLLGSGGGPENASTTLGLIVLLVPSLFLGTSFLLLMLAVHYYTPESKKIWSHAGLVFAVIYAALVSINYFVQLTFVVPNMAEGDLDHVRPFLFTPFNSFIYSVDLLGYSFMSVSTLFAAFAFTQSGLEKTTRRFLIANGLLLPFIALQNFYHPLIWIASLWAITFPGATICLTILFRRERSNV
jgi:hypothetical protein